MSVFIHGILSGDSFSNSFCWVFALGVISYIFKLYLFWQPCQATGESRRDHGVGKLPNTAHRVFKGPVAIYQNFDILTRFFLQCRLQLGDKDITVARKELNGKIVGVV